MFLLQDDIVKFVSEPASPPRLMEFPEEGKGKAKERHEVGEGDDTVTVEAHQMKMTRKRFRSGSSYGRGSIALDCLMFLSTKILQLVWRLVCLRHQGGHATWHASASPRS
jgi:hypothetical protein